MKRIFYTLGLTFIVAMVITSCGSKTGSANTPAVAYGDTVGLSEFQSWKAHNERVAAIDAYQQSVAKTSAPATRKRSTSSRQSGSMNSSSQNEAKVASKKGWSKAAKGAAIGAGSGAILGAVINKKNRALGAVIGGVVGGGVGYGIGRSKDKKDGRY